MRLSLVSSLLTREDFYRTQVNLGLDRSQSLVYFAPQEKNLAAKQARLTWVRSMDPKLTNLCAGLTNMTLDDSILTYNAFRAILCNMAMQVA